MWNIGIVKEGQTTKGYDMTSKWGNVDEETTEKVSNKKRLDSYCDALTLCADLTSIIMANKFGPHAVVTAVAMLFGVAYKVACKNKTKNMEDIEVFEQMVKISFSSYEDYEEWACQEGKVGPKVDVEN